MSPTNGLQAADLANQCKLRHSRERKVIVGHRRYSGPVIDSHVHVDGGNLSLVRDIATRNEIAAMVDLWNGQLPPPAFDDWSRELWQSPARGGREGEARSEAEFEGLDLLLYHTPDLSRVGSRDFADSVAHDVRSAAEAGAAGIKVWKNLGLRIRDDRGELVSVDDPRLDPLWRTAGETGLPVSIHAADPVAFFEPLDESNERYEELSLHPEWWFGSEEFPAFEEVIGALENVVARTPQTTFIGVHLGCYAENLEFVGRMLDSYPNYFVDTAARIGEFGRHGAAVVREFFISYADRILFGTDLARTRALWLPEDRFYDSILEDFYDLHWRYFETAEKGLRHPFPEQGSWTVDGIDLPGEVLESLYYNNARRAIPTLGERETHAAGERRVESGVVGEVRDDRGR